MPKISQLPTDSSPSLTDYVPTLDQETTTTKRTLLSSLRDLVFNNIPSSSSIITGWQTLSATLSTSTGYNKGNRFFDITTSVDLTSVLSPGMKLKITRGTSPSTQCADLEASSTQYANRTSASVSGITFTDDFTVEAWIKIESYGSNMTIISRQSSTNGWNMYVNSTGNLIIQGVNASSVRAYQSYGALPLGRWVHVAATLDMSAGAYTMYFDGVSNTAASIAASPSSLVQAGDLSIGTYNGTTNPFDGKLADVRLWNVVRTATQIQDNMCQALVGNETNLVGYWKLNGNFNDSTSNANHLTGQNSAVATNSDNPWGSSEYCSVITVTASTITVHGGQNSTIPNMTLSSPYYSVHENPFGLPEGLARNRLLGIAQLCGAQTTVTPTSTTQIQGLSVPVYIPTGSRVKITATAGVGINGSVSQAIGYAICDGAAADSTRICQSNTTWTSGGGLAMHVEGIFSYSGNKTFTVGVNCASGNTTVNGSTVGPAILKVELV